MITKKELDFSFSLLNLIFLPLPICAKSFYRSNPILLNLVDDLIQTWVLWCLKHQLCNSLWPLQICFSYFVLWSYGYLIVCSVLSHFWQNLVFIFRYGTWDGIDDTSLRGSCLGHLPIKLTQLADHGFSFQERSGGFEPTAFWVWSTTRNNLWTSVIPIILLQFLRFVHLFTFFISWSLIRTHFCKWEFCQTSFLQIVESQF